VTDLNDFCTNLQQEILADAQARPDGTMLADVYTSRMIEYLTEAGELDDGEVCYHRARGVEVSGYAVDDDDGTASLFLSLFTQSAPPIGVGKLELDGAFNRLTTFLHRCQDGYAATLEEASPARDMALRINEALRKGYTFRLYVLTDGVVTKGALSAADEKVAGYEVWDAERLYRCLTSGRGRERIDINFEELSGSPIPCLHAQDEAADYDAYLLILSGQVLNDMYARYGPRLLELNVRSFLQVRGKVNKGIRDTILNEPEHFLAYNNGISATASKVELLGNERVGLAIRSAVDFQIVNGGQTTASIHHAVRADKADVSRISVQAKLTVVPADRVGAFVPLVSRYANTQNKVNEADFSANDPFHVKLEELSRTVWAPAVQGSARQTKWFYERARGQYQDALSREVTTARQREFKAIYPAEKKFTKTDLAKFENSWDQAPEMVSRGAEKNFREFALRLARRGPIQVDEEFFRHLVARALIFRRAEEAISALHFPGYRANVVTYTVAYLAHATSQRIDLDLIWRQQSITTGLREAIDIVSPLVFKQITNPPGAGNVTEWCKRTACWDSVRDLNINLPTTLIEEVPSGPRTTTRGMDAPSAGEQELIQKIAALEAECWFKLAAWAKETDNLQGWQRGIAFSLGRYKTMRREPSRKQAQQAVIILAEAQRLGFRAEACKD